MNELIKKLIERLNAELPMYASAWRLKMNEIVNQAAEEYGNEWIPVSKKLPPHSDELVLVQCSGKPKSNIHLENALCLASYEEEGWILEMFPEWEEADVVAWQPLPAPYQPKGE